jgi:predicted thioredoxin/glutaredoxin
VHHGARGEFWGYIAQSSRGQTGTNQVTTETLRMWWEARAEEVAGRCGISCHVRDSSEEDESGAMGPPVIDMEQSQAPST